MVTDIRYGSLKVQSPENIYVFPDIHGEYAQLCLLLEQIKPYLSYYKTHLVFCGDYCNRLGENSPAVLEKLIELKKTYPDRVFCIKGNHEEMLLSTLKGSLTWFDYSETTLKQMVDVWNLPLEKGKLRSYLKEMFKACEERGIIDFLENLLPYYESKDTICTHAPLDKSICSVYSSVKYDQYYLANKEDPNIKYFLDRMISELTWEFTSEDEPYVHIPSIKKLLVCGHQFKQHKQPRMFKDRVFLDTGCGCVENRPLIALKLPEKKIIKESC